MADLTADYLRRLISPEFLLRFTISAITGALTQLSLLTIPILFPSFSLLFHLLLSAVVFVTVIGITQSGRRVAGFRASAPVFVFFHLLFVWIVYTFIIRAATSKTMDVTLNAELTLLLIGFFRMLFSDPGFVRHSSSSSLEDSVPEDEAYSEELTFSVSDHSSSNEMIRRVRYCRSCKAFVRGFDHHCPAFGNCIGQKNYRLFMILLVGFAVTEASYAVCCYQWIERYHKFIGNNLEMNVYETLGVSTMLFSMLQVIWQVVFLAWHIYCICANIKTDEWINWRKYPEFHFIGLHSSGESELGFTNPYNKGFVHNLKDFLLGRD